jgi:uncharacterized protein
MEVDAEGIGFAVRITPKAARDALGGMLDLPDGRSAIAVRIAAPPVDGAANAALIAFLAKRLGVRKADVAIRSGEASRLKIIRIMGDGPALAARLDTLLEGRE